MILFGPALDGDLLLCQSTVLMVNDDEWEREQSTVPTRRCARVLEKMMVNYLRVVVVTKEVHSFQTCCWLTVGDIFRRAYIREETSCWRDATSWAPKTTTVVRRADEVIFRCGCP